MTFGLVLFLLVVAGDVLGLLLDTFFIVMGWETITGEARRMPFLAVALVAWQLMGAVGLAWHLWR